MAANISSIATGAEYEEISVYSRKPNSYTRPTSILYSLSRVTCLYGTPYRANSSSATAGTIPLTSGTTSGYIMGIRNTEGYAIDEDRYNLEKYAITISGGKITTDASGFMDYTYILVLNDPNATAIST